MTGAEAIAAEVSRILPNAKQGDIRFWGVHFGRPFDTTHRITASSAEGDELVVDFDSGERLIVIRPAEWSVDRQTFVIRCAERVTWQTFDYGEPRTPEHTHQRDFVREADGIVLSPRPSPYSGSDRPDPSQPAVQIVSYYDAPV